MILAFPSLFNSIHFALFDGARVSADTSTARDGILKLFLIAVISNLALHVEGSITGVGLMFVLVILCGFLIFMYIEIYFVYAMILLYKILLIDLMIEYDMIRY